MKRYAIGLGWMGTACLLVAPYLLPGDYGSLLYIAAGFLLTPQVLMAKHYNLLVLNINMIIAFTIFYLTK